jgi:hypothetical protein
MYFHQCERVYYLPLGALNLELVTRFDASCKTIDVHPLLCICHFTPLMAIAGPPPDTTVDNCMYYLNVIDTCTSSIHIVQRISCRCCDTLAFSAFENQFLKCKNISTLLLCTKFWTKYMVLSYWLSTGTTKYPFIFPSYALK